MVRGILRHIFPLSQNKKMIIPIEIKILTKSSTLGSCVTWRIESDSLQFTSYTLKRTFWTMSLQYTRYYFVISFILFSILLFWWSRTCKLPRSAAVSDAIIFTFCSTSYVALVTSPMETRYCWIQWLHHVYTSMVFYTSYVAVVTSYPHGNANYWSQWLHHGYDTMAFCSKSYVAKVKR